MRSSIDRILVGDNPFIGVDHLSQERSREKGNRSNSARIPRVIDTALEAGAQGLVCSAHPIMKDALADMRKMEYQKHFGVYLIVPDAQSYVRLASEKGMLGLVTDIFGKQTLKGKTRTLLRGSFSALTMDPKRLIAAYLNMEASIFAKSLPKNANLKSIFLHELLTELIVSFNMSDLVKTYIDFVRDSLNLIPGFVTRNFARFANTISSMDVDLQDIAVLTPFNKLGFQMNPNRESCEESLLRIPKAQIIAMSLLAAGYLSLNDATDYLTKLPRSVSCVVGVSTQAHAKETFSFLRDRLI
ncbi:MAG: hypothetical protein ACYCQJ_02780 [Nitrososphaerales archaeon]